MTTQAPLLIINEPERVSLPTTCAFVAIEREIEKLPKGAHQAGFAMVEVYGLHYEFFKVFELKGLPIDPQAVMQYALAVNAKKHFSRLYIDLENFTWFNGKGEWNQMLRLVKDIDRLMERPVKPMPSLKPLGKEERGKESTLRQISTLQGPLSRNEIIFHDQLKKSQVVSVELSQVGKSVVCDALAGAMYKARDLQRQLLRWRADNC